MRLRMASERERGIRALYTMGAEPRLVLEETVPAGAAPAVGVVAGWEVNPPAAVAWDDEADLAPPRRRAERRSNTLALHRPHPEEPCGFAWRTEGAEVPSAEPLKLARVPHLLETQTQAGLLLAVGSCPCLTGLRIPAIRCAPAGMTGWGWRGSGLALDLEPCGCAWRLEGQGVPAGCTIGASPTLVLRERPRAQSGYCTWDEGVVARMGGPNPRPA